MGLSTESMVRTCYCRLKQKPSSYVSNPKVLAHTYDRKARLGMWVNGTNIETPGEYKRRHSSSPKPDSDEVENVEEAAEAEVIALKERSWLRKISASGNK